MSRKPYIVSDEATRAAVSALVGKLALEKPWAITVEPYVKKRSLSQNSLMWRWINDVADKVRDETGNDADAVHDFFKQKFLSPEIVEIGGETTARYTTTNLSVQEMKDYMDRIYAFVTSELGILLPLPEEMLRR